MNPYAGNPDSFPGTIPLPDDSDPPAAATFNPAEQGNADRTAALAAGYRSELADIATLKAIDTTATPDGATRVVKGYGCYKLDKTIGPTDTEDLPAVVAPTTGTGRWFAQDDIAKSQWVKTFDTVGFNAFTMPRNIALIYFVVVGGGGGGGGGSGADTSASDTVGGGGGGGSRKCQGYLDVTGLGPYQAAVGDGGNGGAANSNGSDGTSSAIIDPSSDIVASCISGQGGTGGTVAVADVGSMKFGFAPGGAPVGTNPHPPCYSSTDYCAPTLLPAGGGYGTNSQALNVVSAPGSTSGMTSPEGGDGGSAGARGATGGGHIGGGAGAGGGGGPFVGSNGGVGGDGGAGSGSGAGANGSAGGSPGAGCYGAGGAGGGGAGQGSSGGGTGGAGGKGFQGVIIIRGVR